MEVLRSDLPPAAPDIAPRPYHAPRLTLSVIVHYCLLNVLLFLTFFLVLLMIDLSLRPSLLIYVDFWALPWPPTFANYQAVLWDLLPSMARTLLVAVASIAGILLTGAGAAYAFARIRMPGREFLYYGVLAVMTIPGVILLTPDFVLANQLGLRGTLFGLIVFYIAGGLPFAIFLITTFFRSQPVEIFEAARIDGAGELSALWRIAIPLAIPILVTVGIMNFLSIYGDFIWPSLMVPQSQETLMLALEHYDPQISQFVSRPDIGMQSAGYVFATLPQLVLFAFGMKYFIEGVSSGAVKA